MLAGEEGGLVKLFWRLEYNAELAEIFELNHYPVVVAFYRQQIELKTAHDLDY